MIERADFVICGGGSAGCVLANRLSENPNYKVTLLEAGPHSDRVYVAMPAAIMQLLTNPEVNWGYKTEPDPTLGGRASVWSAGKMLGGGSSINGMVYIRGTRYDYDQWAENGCTGWSWDDVLPYFIRSEDFDGLGSPIHGKGGPLAVSHLTIKHPLADPFVDACAAVGIRRIEDYCAGDLDGAFINLATQRNGQRCSSARGFLGAAAGRPNLTIVTGALVDRVLFEGMRAIGVRFLQDGAAQEVRADREVVVSGGTIGSPAILLRSGIGPGADLQSLGIGVRVDAPDVGRNLQEHPSCPSSYYVSVPTYNASNIMQRAGYLLSYFLRGSGPLTTCTVHAMAHARSKPGLPHPDIKLQFLPYCLDMETRALNKRSGIQISINITPPKSRGEIRLRSSDSTQHPVIDHRLYSDPADLDAMIAGSKLVDRLFAMPSLAKFVTGRCFPAETPRDDAAYAEIIKKYSQIGFHAVATCRMGGDARSVVDPTLQVRGVTGLRVADASIMPIMPSCNTNAPAIMVGEKAADLVKQAAR